MSKIFKIFVDILFVLLIIGLGLYFALRVIGIAEIYKVETGSMEDGIHTGDYILIFKANEYKVDDVVTYEINGYYITHRIIKKDGNRVITKGDANNVADKEISVKNIVGKVVYNGGLLNVLIDYKYIFAAVLFAFYLLSCYIGEEQTKK